MLTSLSLCNFKSWKEIDGMRLAPITGLFGTNSSGKSSILQFFLLMKQTVDSADRRRALNLRDERSLVSFGRFPDLVYRHEHPGRLQWAFSWRLPEALTVPDPEQPGRPRFDGREMSFEATLTERGSFGVGAVERMAYHFDEHEFGMADERNGLEYRLFTAPEDFQFKHVSDRPDRLPPPLKCYGFPDEVRAYYQNAGFLADFELAFENLFARVHYLGPLREPPRREYPWAGTQPTSVGPRGEYTIDALLAARAAGTQVSPAEGRKPMSLEAKVAARLRDLGLLHDLSIKRYTAESDLYVVGVKQSKNAPLVRLPEVGFGVSQVLPVLVLCYYVPEGSIILLEQPELHLHPRVQTELADVLMDVVKTRNVQIIVESHSEHLLRRLQRRVAEERFAPEDAALYFCEMVDGASRLTPLQLDEYGNIVNWPDGFFGDDFGELAAMTRAAMERKRRLSA